MDLQGNIENFKLPDILQLLSQGRKSGTLGIQHDEDIVMVYFRNGAIVYSYGPRKTNHLGQILKERGRVSASQLAAAVTRQNSEGGDRRLGQILMEMGVVDRADIIEVVREQVEELLFSLMSWESGSFKFYENQFPTDEEVTVDLSTENVILEGLRRLDEMNHLRDTLPRMDGPLLIAQAAAGHGINIELSPEEWNLLALIDGRRTIADIVEISNLSEIETLKKLAALKLAGLISESESAPEKTETASGDVVTQSSTQLTAMMQRLTTLLEDYLTAGSGAGGAGGAVPSMRTINGAPLSSIIAESVVEIESESTSEQTNTVDESAQSAAADQQPEAEGPEERLWNEFTR